MAETIFEQAIEAILNGDADKATEIAKKMGNEKVANIVMLGALIKTTKILKTESMIKALEKPFSGEKRSLLYINISAFSKGMEQSKCMLKE